MGRQRGARRPLARAAAARATGVLPGPRPTPASQTAARSACRGRTSLRAPRPSSGRAAVRGTFADLAPGTVFSFPARPALTVCPARRRPCRAPRGHMATATRARRRAPGCAHPDTTARPGALTRRVCPPVGSARWGSTVHRAALRPSHARRRMPARPVRRPARATYPAHARRGTTATRYLPQPRCPAPLARSAPLRAPRAPRSAPLAPSAASARPRRRPPRSTPEPPRAAQAFTARRTMRLRRCRVRRGRMAALPASSRPRARASAMLGACAQRAPFRRVSRAVRRAPTAQAVRSPHCPAGLAPICLVMVRPHAPCAPPHLCAPLGPSCTGVTTRRSARSGATAHPDTPRRCRAPLAVLVGPSG